MRQAISWQWAGCALAVVLASLTTARGDLKFVRGDKRAPKRVTKLVMDSGAGRVEILRQLWSNTIVYTESGKPLGLTDPFMYSSYGSGADGARVGGYWSKPELFDQWKVEKIVDPARPDATIVKIAAEQPGLCVRKEITIAIEKGERVAYVFSRLVALADIRSVSDRPTIYLSRPAQSYTFLVDGKVLTPKPRFGTPIRHYAIFQSKASGASAAVVFMDRSGSGRLLFHLEGKANGAELFWTTSGAMKKGATRSHRYVVVWGDGDLTDKVETLSKQAMAGELKAKFHALP